MKALRKNYIIILSILAKLSCDNNENSCTILEAGGVIKKFLKIETVFNIVLLDTLLQRLHVIYIDLQKSTTNLTQVIPLYHSLMAFTQYARDNFDQYEKLAEKDVEYHVSKRKKSQEAEIHMQLIAAALI